MTDKRKLLNQVIAELEAKLATLASAARETKNYATDKDSKAESKYDTRALEASYLAGAQAGKAQELRDEIGILRQFHPPEDASPAVLGSLVTLTDDDGMDEAYFLLPAGGGTEVDWHGLRVTAVTRQSPQGKRLFGLDTGTFLDPEGWFVSDVC